MSLVSAFATAAHSQAATTIGKESITIGSSSILSVLNEIADSTDYSEGGFERIKLLSAVCLTSDLPTESILKRAVTARGESFRVSAVSKGATFSTITLEQSQKS